MKCRLLHLFILFLLVLGSKASAQVNTEAIDAYWGIAEQLKQDKDPSSQAWEAFFALPGNKLALQHRKDLKEARNAIRNAMQLVYMPGKRAQLQATPVDYFLDNILYTRDQEPAIKEHVAFVKEGSMLDSMYKLAYQYLPSHWHRKVKNLKVYYIGPLSPDSRAMEDAFFINAAMEARFFPKRTAYVGAHELHHLLLPQERSYQLTTSEHARYVGVAMLAKSLHREGIADLIDKKYFLLQPGDTLYRPLMEKSLQESDSMIIKLNTELERLATDPNKPAQLRAFMSRGGHAPGHYMALVIERNGYLPELLKNIDRPFTFLYIYNKAAQKDEAKPPAFSSTAITFLKRVETLFP